MILVSENKWRLKQPYSDFSKHRGDFKPGRAIKRPKWSMKWMACIFWWSRNFQIPPIPPHLPPPPIKHTGTETKLVFHNDKRLA